MVLEIFLNSPPFERSACFYVAISEILNIFSTLTLKPVLWKAKTFFKKLEYNFLAESTKIENVSFQYKAAISEANFEINIGEDKMDLSQRTEFWKFYSCLRTSYKELIRCTNNPNAHIRTVCRRGILFDCGFSLWVP